jgi:hypothetical protein
MKDELKALAMLVRKWADEKHENRRGWRDEIFH